MSQKFIGYFLFVIVLI